MPDTIIYQCDRNWIISERGILIFQNSPCVVWSQLGMNASFR